MPSSNYYSYQDVKALHDNLIEKFSKLGDKHNSESMGFLKQTQRLSQILATHPDRPLEANCRKLMEAGWSKEEAEAFYFDEDDGRGNYLQTIESPPIVENAEELSLHELNNLHARLNKSLDIKGSFRKSKLYTQLLSTQRQVSQELKKYEVENTISHIGQVQTSLFQYEQFNSKNRENLAKVIRTWAKKHHQAGRNVIPLFEFGKGDGGVYKDSEYRRRFLVAFEKHGYKTRRMTDEEFMKEFYSNRGLPNWEEFPATGLALLVGRISGVVCLDFDLGIILK